jgi:hypothetical protein
MLRKGAYGKRANINFFELCNCRRQLSICCTIRSPPPPTQRDDKNPIVDALCAEIRTANDRLAAAVGVSSRSSHDRQ